MRVQSRLAQVTKQFPEFFSHSIYCKQLPSSNPYSQVGFSTNYTYIYCGKSFSRVGNIVSNNLNFTTKSQVILYGLQQTYIL
jgi:hypothetical protein